MHVLFYSYLVSDCINISFTMAPISNDSPSLALSIIYHDLTEVRKSMLHYFHDTDNPINIYGKFGELLCHTRTCKV